MNDVSYSSGRIGKHLFVLDHLSGEQDGAFAVSTVANQVIPLENCQCKAVGVFPPALSVRLSCAPTATPHPTLPHCNKKQSLSLYLTPGLVVHTIFLSRSPPFITVRYILFSYI